MQGSSAHTVGFPGRARAPRCPSQPLLPPGALDPGGFHSWLCPGLAPPGWLHPAFPPALALEDPVQFAGPTPGCAPTPQAHTNLGHFPGTCTPHPELPGPGPATKGRRQSPQAHPQALQLPTPPLSSQLVPSPTLCSTCTLNAKKEEKSVLRVGTRGRTGVAVKVSSVPAAGS